MLNVNYKGTNVRCNGIVDGARISNACGTTPFRKMGVHHAGGGIISNQRLDQRPKQETERYKPLFANIPSAKQDVRINRDNVSVKGDSGNNIKKLNVSSALNSRRSSSDRINGIRKIHDSTLDSNSTTKHSIIGFKHRRHSDTYTRSTRHQRQPDTKPSLTETKVKTPTPNSAPDDHETKPLYQRHWFSRELELLDDCGLSARSARLDMTHMELRRQFSQMKSALARWKKSNEKTKNDFFDKLKAKVKQEMIERRKKLTQRKLSVQSALSSKSPQPSNLISIPGSNPVPRFCVTCNSPALPCTKYCANHIMSSSDQVLFDFCTAKFSDNTQCSRPVFDVAHELPLCAEHARKRDNYDKMCAEIKPKKHSSSQVLAQPKDKETQNSRRRSKSSGAMIRPQRRSKKRKRSSANSNSDSNSERGTVVRVASTTPQETNPSLNQSIVNTTTTTEELDDGLATVEHALVTQATRLLEETDFTTVLNQIPADEFNELFGDPRNGVYGEPSAEETEELERALIAVDQDVKSLEKLSQTHALLDQFLTVDDEVLVDVATDELPDVVFHTAYVAATPQ